MNRLRGCPRKVAGRPLFGVRPSRIAGMAVFVASDAVVALAYQVDVRASAAKFG